MKKLEIESPMKPELVERTAEYLAQKGSGELRRSNSYSELPNKSLVKDDDSYTFVVNSN